MKTISQAQTQATLAPLQDKTIAIIGCGSQGHAHALNLQDSGIKVVVGLRPGSKTWAKAEAAGLTVLETSEAAAQADIIMMLVPDTEQAAIYESSILPYMTAGKSLVFAHGFNIHYNTITPASDIDVWMVAPKGPGHIVRQTFTQDFGVPALIAIHQDATGHAYELALAYATAIGAARAGVIDTTFQEETETDLFGEQTILCGGVVQLVMKGFETLTEAGYKPEVAYFECLHELKLIVDLIHVGGISAMNYSISDTAEWGEYVSGNRIVDDAIKHRMKEVLTEIQDGTFARKWIEENKTGKKNFQAYRDALIHHPIETVGEALRDQMKIKERMQGGGSKQFLAEEAKKEEYKA